MKRFLCVVVLICFVFSSCSQNSSDQSMQDAIDFRTSLMAAEGCTFQAQVSADYGERVYEFTLGCEFVPEGEARLTVLSPDMISGVSAVIGPDGTNIEFDGAVLDFGTMANGRVAPMALPWLLGRAWCSEYIRSAGRDGDQILITCLMGYGEDEVVIETWLSDDRVPVRCDISYDGQRCIAASISDFRLN